MHVGGYNRTLEGTRSSLDSSIENARKAGKKQKVQFSLCAPGSMIYPSSLGSVPATGKIRAIRVRFARR